MGPFLKCPKNEININIFQFKLNWVILINLVFVDIFSISILDTKKKKHYNELGTGIFNSGDVILDFLKIRKKYLIF